MKQPLQFVFCHGFGFNQKFWQQLAPKCSTVDCQYIDLGYFSATAMPILDTTPTFRVGVGHSLGLRKLIDTEFQFDCLIGLNGFIDFLGQNPALQSQRQKELRLLTSRFVESPIETLEHFYARAGIPELLMDSLGISFDKMEFNALREALIYLNKTAPELPNLPTIPILLIGTQDDSIVPPSLLADNLQTYPSLALDIINGGRHALGFLQPEQIYTKIMTFVDELQKKRD